MKIKQGVITTGVCPQIWYAAGVVDAIYRNKSCLMVITSMVDGIHMSGSKHSTGEAMDIRTLGLTQSEGDIIYAQIKSLLDPQGFDTVDERNKPGVVAHFHIEFDPKAGEEWLQLV